MMLVISKIAPRLRGPHVFMRQSPGILNVFSTLTFKQVLWNTKTFLKELCTVF